MLTKHLHQRITFNYPFSAAHRYKDLIALDVFLFAIFFGIISLGYYLATLGVGWCNLDICAVNKKKATTIFVAVFQD